MKKLGMCRICLAENVYFFEVTSKSLQELYQKLTDIPFVTEDSRPIVACSFCCTKLKKCFQLMRKCLDAEELFALMMNEDYVPKHSQHTDRLEFNGGFVKTEIQTISIVDVVHTESIVVKEEIPAVCERLDDVIETKMEYKSYDIKKENPDDGDLDREEDVLSLSHDIEEDSEDDVPLVEFKIEVKEEQIVSEQKRKAVEICYIKQEKIDTGDSDREDVLSLSHNIKEKPEVDEPLTELKKEVEVELEVAQKKQRVVEKSCSTDWKKSKLNLRRSKGEDSITAGQQKNQHTNFQNLLKERHSCDICQRSFSKKRYLSVHIRTHVSEKPYKCDVCHRCFNNKSYLKRHMLIHAGKKSYKCDVCQRSFTQSACLKGHMVIHTGEKPYKCDVCQACFARKSNLDQHNRVHTGEKNPYRKPIEKPYQCDLCQMSFGDKSDLRRHIRLHTGEKPYKCDVCQRCFNNKAYLKKHMLIHAGKKSYKCDVCQRCFTQSAHLKGHMVTHTGEKPYKCDVCQACFARKKNLDQHNRVHTGEKNPYRKPFEKPYQCDICQMSFSDKRDLKRHIRLHTGEKPYKCGICQRGFIQKRHLTTHIRTHTGERPFKCELCQRCFRDSGDLKKHIQIHTGEKPYKCDFCQRCFGRSQNLRKHIRRHTVDKPFHCNICQLKFNSKNTLNQHMRKKHSQGPVQDDNNVSEDLVKSTKDGAPVLE